jgi:hypothetical protein
MKRMCLYLPAMTILCAAFAASSAFGQRSYDDRVDIAELWTSAVQHFDTAGEDVIILSQSVTRYPDGRFATTVHCILWVNSSLAIDERGDIRVPFDQEHCTFAPLAVRTWRDGRWWPSDSTGVVETLPFELEHAYDYTGMREMMLLLNGLEVPCTIEVAYRIEDKTPYRTNAEGVWLFARTDPAVESWFEFCAPTGTRLNVSVSGGEASRESLRDQETGMERTLWRMKYVPAQSDPHGADPAADSPHLVWSTWNGWRDLGTLVSKSFGADVAPDSTLSAAVDSLSNKARTVDDRVKSIADFVNDRVALVDYAEDYWWTSPRSADRIYRTAYAHRLDRSILAAALFRLAGLQAEPLFVSKSPAPVEPDVASLARFDGMALRVYGEGISDVYDPSDGAISSGDGRLYGHSIWSPGVDAAPHFVEPVKGTLDVRVDLKFDKEKSGWVGSGTLAAVGGLCPFDQMTGLDGSGKEYVDSVAESLIEGVSVDDYSPERFDESGITVGFTVELDSIEPDEYGRTVLSIGEPDGGIISHLPSQAELFRRELRSSIYLPFLMSQSIEIRIDTTGHQVVYRPEDVSMKNAAGWFSVRTVINNSQLVLARELHLEKTLYRPADWPELRDLLLAERQNRNGLIILKDTDGDKSQTRAISAE